MTAISNRMTTLFQLALLVCSFLAASASHGVERNLGVGYMSMSMETSSPTSSSLKSTKSKGKGDSSADDIDDDYYAWSMSYNTKSTKSTKAKDGKDGKDGKSTKSTKAPKSAKSKGSPSPTFEGETYAPTVTPEPTAAPIAPTPTTPSPTSENSIPIRATVYALSYTGEFTRIPEDGEFAEVTEITRAYLEEFMIAEFSQTSLTNLDDFLTVLVRNAFEFDEPVENSYRSTGLFNPSSIFLPTVRELDELIEEAFTGDNLATYLGLVQDLPSANIFSTTTAVSKGLPTVSVSDSDVAVSSFMGSTGFKSGIAAAAAGIVVLAAGLALYKRRQGESEGVDPYEGNLKGDSATVAGETCATSVDGSSQWRKTSPYAKELNEDEFHDEPIDSDDEDDTHPEDEAEEEYSMDGQSTLSRSTRHSMRTSS
eukprot:Nitzschia sp. Nitz4//scaffold163_size50693//9642//10991//NITZ4_006983-RA/size50693-snap-gene-0.66-mRNA-1//-1//CDS//3329538016//8848//frame0